MTLQNNIRILIADDHPVIRRGLALMLQYEADMEVIAEAKNGLEALEMFRLNQPDVTLMDLRMPVMDGVEAIIGIRTEFPNARIILLTTYDGDEDIYQGLRAGAKAYLLKDAPCEELLEALRVVYTGQKIVMREVGTKLAERAGLPDLTERELQVLRMLAKGKNNQEIGAALFIAEGTIKFHMNHILSKLGVEDRTQAVIVALKRGLAHLN